MNNFILVLACFGCLNSFAQIEIGPEDLPTENSEYYLSNANPLNDYDFSLTGEDYTWDFSMLEPVSQQVQSFVPVSSAPFAYQLFFNNPFDQEHYASFAIATEGIDFSDQFSFQDFYSFYQKNEEAYSIVGNAGTINGIPLPAQSNPVDVIYDLPLNYSSTGTNYSEWQIQVPGFLTYKLKQTRNYEVDGWGTLITPFGSFEALRVKMEIDAIDSVSIDALSFNFENERNSIEYQWLAPEMGAAVLVATENLGFVTGIVYQDEEVVSVRVEDDSEFMLYPNPANAQVFVDAPEGSQLQIFNTTGQLVREFAVQRGFEVLDVSSWTSGRYVVLDLLSGRKTSLIIQH